MINFYNAIPTSNTITTKIRPDLGTPCVQNEGGDNTRVMMVVGTVTDRYGAVSEVCDRTRNLESDNPCPLVTLTGVPDISVLDNGEPDADILDSGILDIKPSDVIRDVKAQLGKNHMTRRITRHRHDPHVL